MKAGFVGMIGLPNAGKSTLVNTLVGEKISIVTPKPQTTRKRLLGISGDDSYQAIFVDSPGMIESGKGLNEFIKKECARVIEESDVLLAVLNLDERHPANLTRILDVCRGAGKPWAVVMTKSDLATENRVGFIRAETLNDGVIVEVVSATTDPKGTCAKIKAIMEKVLPDAPAPLFDPELLTTENLREMAGEIVREKCFEELGDEIPYGLGVKVQLFNEERSHIVEIKADIVVDKASHKPMVIGSAGSKIKRIGEKARIDIERMLEKKVFLQLHVVVKDKWTRSPSQMKEMGYVVQAE